MLSLVDDRGSAYLNCPWGKPKQSCVSLHLSALMPWVGMRKVSVSKGLTVCRECTYPQQSATYSVRRHLRDVRMILVESSGT